MLAVKNIVDNIPYRQNIWDVNMEEDYLEEK
jgi:hypothetical protein